VHAKGGTATRFRCELVLNRAGRAVTRVSKLVHMGSNVGRGDAFFPPAARPDVQAGELDSAPVFLLNDGQTAISHDTTNGVQNTLINTAAGLNAVQEVEASLSLSGYDSFNADLMADRLGSALDSLVGQAGIGALGN